MWNFLLLTIFPCINLKSPDHRKRNIEALAFPFRLEICNGEASEQNRLQNKNEYAGLIDSLFQKAFFLLANFLILQSSSRTLQKADMNFSKHHHSVPNYRNLLFVNIGFEKKEKFMI